MSVSGRITVGVNLTEILTAGTAGTIRIPVALGTSPIPIADGSGDYQLAKLWSATLAFLVSTPQTLDLRALPGPAGSSILLATVKFLYILPTSVTAAHRITVGNAAADPWSAPWSGATVTEDAYAGSPLVKSRLLGAGWTVDATHKNLKLDPGANAQGAVIVIGGT